MNDDKPLFAHFVDRLYIGNTIAATDTQLLTTAKITTIFSFDEEYSVQPKVRGIVVYYHAMTSNELVSWEFHKVTGKLEACAKQIQTLLEDPEQRVLVSCHGGKNRSALLIAYYVITRLKWSYSTMLSAFSVLSKSMNTQLLTRSTHRELLKTATSHLT
jgi:hypothetical protein